MNDFANVLVEISGFDVEMVIVEASGLADPSNLEDIIEGANARCGNAYNFTGSICLVDAMNYLKLSTALPALVRQVEVSNYIFISKCHNVDEETLLAIEKKFAV